MRSINTLFLGLLILIACKKDPTPISGSSTTLHNGLLVLNEGLFQQNNSSLSWVNLSSGEILVDAFLEKNGRLLGDTGNDLLVYGDKIYVVVNNSNTIEVVDRSNLKSIKQLEMSANSIGKQPRNMTYHSGNIYISCFDGFVDVLDTATLTITERIPVGQNPEDLVVSNNRLFVSNSGGLNYPNVDSTVSVIDLATKSEITRITVGKNPGKLEVDTEGNVYVISRGNYSNIPSRMQRINPNSLVVHSYPFDASSVINIEGNLLIHSYNYTTQQSTLKLFDITTQSLASSNFIDVSIFQTIYGIYYSQESQKLYITDAMNYTNTGYVRQFSNIGVLEKSYHVGLNPSSVIYLP